MSIKTDIHSAVLIAYQQGNKIIFPLLMAEYEY